MIGIKQKFISLNLSNKFSSINITDGTQSILLGNRVVQATLFLTFTDVLYVSKFTVSLLSMSQFTKYNNCKIIFFLFHHDFMYRLGRELLQGIKRGGMFYLDNRVSLTGSVAGQPDPVLLGQWCLGHPSVQSFSLQFMLSLLFSLQVVHLVSQTNIIVPLIRIEPITEVVTLLSQSIQTVKDFRYSHFLDGFSRMTWLYLLKDRPEVPGVI